MYLKKSDLLKYRAAFLAQMVERWPFKPMVVGSIPTEGAFFVLRKFQNLERTDLPGKVHLFLESDLVRLETQR